MPNTTLLPRLATRVFRTPLLIHPDKLNVILSVLGQRVGIQGQANEDALIFDAGEDEQRVEITQEGVAVIPVTGTLVQRTSGIDAASGLMSFDGLRESIDAAISDPAVKAILLDVDSPGGEANGAFDAADAIRAKRGRKPMVAIANEMAFSAAYAIASAADRVFIPRTGGVGSVGVIAAHVDQSGFDAEMGLNYSFVFAGERKIDGNPHLPLTDRARSDIQDEVDRVYEIFVQTVAANRGIDAAVVRQTEAATFFGQSAVDAQLADDVRTFRATLAGLAQRRRTGFVAGAHRRRPTATTSKRGKPMAGVSKLRAGENLARVLDELIEDQVTEDRDRSDVIDDMASAAGISSSTVNQILNAGIDCPPPERLEGFAEVLDTSFDNLRQAAEEDGCEFGGDDDEGNQARRQGTKRMATTNKKAGCTCAPASKGAVGKAAANAADVLDAAESAGVSVSVAKQAIRDGLTLDEAKARFSDIGAIRERAVAAYSGSRPLLSQDVAEKLAEKAIAEGISADKFSAQLLEKAAESQSTDDAIHSRTTPDTPGGGPSADQGWKDAFAKVGGLKTA